MIIITDFAYYGLDDGRQNVSSDDNPPSTNVIR